jgi:hypothetical protein
MNTDYQQKYLKYKEKYINLQKLFGGSKKTAQKYFQDEFIKNKDKVNTILKKDINLLKDSELLKKDSEIIFNKIYDYLNEHKIYENGKELDLNKYIDWIIKSYIYESFGAPNSLENFGRFKEAIQKYEILSNRLKTNPTLDDLDYYEAIHQLKDTFVQLDKIKGLIELENFIHHNYDILQLIEFKDYEKEKKKQEQILLKKRGEKDVNIILDTPKIIIYSPTSENGSKYYGRNTRWCTAAKENCMFNYYNEGGPLYIIQSKEDPKHKYQLHIEVKQVMDTKDEPVSIKDIKLDFNDPELNRWLDTKVKHIQDEEEKEYLRQYTHSKIMHVGAILMDLGDFFKKIPDLKSLILERNFNLKLKDYLKPLTKLKYLYLQNYIYEPFGDSLKGLINLRILSIQDRNYNMPFGDSLSTLIKLQVLTFSYSFNQPLEDSLKNLVNLKILDFSPEFNKSFENSLNTLTNLKILKLNYNYNQEFGDSLKNLVNLKVLDLSKSTFNKPIGDSLNTLTNLETLSFGNLFDQSLDETLPHLINLKNLNVKILLQTKNIIIYNITTDFTKKNYGINKKFCLNNKDNKYCLNETVFPNFIYYGKIIQSVNNDKIYILNHICELVDNYNTRKDIDELKIEFNDEEFNKFLKHEGVFFIKENERIDPSELKIISNIEKMIGNLKEYFEIVLENSEEPITSLIFDDEFNKPLEDSLNILSEHLQHINFGNSFNQPLGDSLSNLANLNSITFGNSFNQPLGDSFKKLFKLQNNNYKPLEPPKRFYDERDEKEYNEEAEEHYENSFLGEIKFGNSFNQPIIDSIKGLPLRSIIVGSSFNQPIDDYGYYKNIIHKDD